MKGACMRHTPALEPIIFLILIFPYNENLTRALNTTFTQMLLAIN